MSIFDTLFGVIKTILPFLRSAVEKSFKALPKDEQERLKKIALLVQIIKLGREQNLSVDAIIANMVNQSGLTVANIEAWFIEYWAQKGQNVGSLKEAVSLILADASQRTETGLKSLWNGIVNLIAGVVSNVDWEALLLGIVQFVYEKFIKGRVKV